MLTSVLVFIVSLGVLIYSSNRFIQSAEFIGLGFGISPYIIGVTLVAFGTSLPELMTSIVSVYQGSSEIVVGNVIGSNITNILLVVGLTTIVAGDLKIKRDLMKIDMSMLLGSACLLWFAISDTSFSFFEGLLFMAGLIIFLLSSLNDRESDVVRNKPDSWRQYVFIILGTVGIYFGASYTVSSISDISMLIGVDAAIVSLTALALGTSLPEVVVSITACRRGNPGMALGNVIGSNVFNTFGVMAIPSFFGKIEIPPSITHFSLPYMIAMSVLLMIITISRSISKWEGFILILFYIYFLVELFTTDFVS